MNKTVYRYTFFLLLIAILAVSGCASSKTNPYAQKKRKSDMVQASNLGKNRYYFSNSYQKKLTKSYKKKRF
jgi:hypothetical protein